MPLDEDFVQPLPRSSEKTTQSARPLNELHLPDEDLKVANRSGLGFSHQGGHPDDSKTTKYINLQSHLALKDLKKMQVTIDKDSERDGCANDAENSFNLEPSNISLNKDLSHVRVLTLNNSAAPGHGKKLFTSRGNFVTTESDTLKKQATFDQVPFKITGKKIGLSIARLGIE